MLSKPVSFLQLPEQGKALATSRPQLLSDESQETLQKTSLELFLSPLDHSWYSWFISPSWSISIIPAKQTFYFMDLAPLLITADSLTPADQHHRFLIHNTTYMALIESLLLPGNSQVSSPSSGQLFALSSKFIQQRISLWTFNGFYSLKLLSPSTIIQTWSGLSQKHLMNLVPTSILGLLLMW